MTEEGATEVAIGNRVRIQFHPPNPMKSFYEGVVRRVDVTTPEGRFFAVEVTHEVIFDREHRIRPGFQDFVRYDCRNDFPGRIEILSTIEQDVERRPASDLLSEQPPEEPQHEVAEQQAVEADVQSYLETGRGPEGETNSEPSPVRLEPQPVRKRGGLLAAWLGRRR